MTNKTIEVRNLTKRFGRFMAVDNLSFAVAPGEAVALWGANGAGKTTVVRCLLNFFPYEGQITVGGLDPRKCSKKVRRLIGFVPQELSFHDDLSVAETLIFYARLKKVPAGFDFEPLLAQLRLAEYVDKKVGELSGGLKQRLALAVALLSDPPILVLDEPTASLDIRAREDFLLLLRGLKHEGKTMIFSSHHLEEITALADRVLLLESGRLVVDAPPDQLERRLGWETTLHLYLPETGIDPAIETLAGLGMLVSRNGRGVRVQVAPGKKGHVLRVLQDAGVMVEDFSVE
ncbi:MAG: ABC transporter ATP-binding protein [Chloroflexota bacterium]